MHNLIIRIEGDNFDGEWRESLMTAGLESEHGDADEDDWTGDTLEQARRRLEMPGQHFRLKLMDNLFNSPSHIVERRP
jgi:hypothetical protein